MIRTVFGRLKSKPTVFEIDTRNIIAGSSDGFSIVIPFQNGFKGTVDWGDGTNNYYDISGISTLTKTYSAQGIYQVKFIIDAGYFFTFYLNNNANRSKFLKVIDWGDKFKIGLNAFLGANNLTLTDVKGIPSFQLNISLAFGSCTSLTSINSLNIWDFSNVVLAGSLFSGATNFNQSFIFISSTCTNIGGMFQNCTSFKPTSLNINTPLCSNVANLFNGIASTFTCSNFSMRINNVANLSNLFFSFINFNPTNFYLEATSCTSMNALFRNCTLFNPSSFQINAPNVTTMVSFLESSPKFNTLFNMDISNVITMNQAFLGVTDFNQDISALNFNKNVTLSGLMIGKTSANFSASNYDALLQRWATLFIGTGRTQTNKAIGMGTIKYTATGKTYRDLLIADGWTITDGGLI